MSEFQTAVLFYVPLQLASLALLPKWWRLTAIPALHAAPGIFFHDGYMGHVFATMFMIYASAYLVVVWLFVGVVKLIRALPREQNKDDASRRPIRSHQIVASSRSRVKMLTALGYIAAMSLMLLGVMTIETDAWTWKPAIPVRLAVVGAGIGVGLIAVFAGRPKETTSDEEQ